MGLPWTSIEQHLPTDPESYFRIINMISQIVLFCLVSLAAAQYKSQYEAPSYPKSYEPAYEAKPEPYSFGYDIKDDNGATQTRKEEGDASGHKKGSYGYTDGYGIYRQVDYIADDKGFRANIKTNEPGTDNQNPADIEIHSEAAPSRYEAAPAYDKAPAYSKPATPSYSRPAPIYKPAPAAYAQTPIYQQPQPQAAAYQQTASSPYQSAPAYQQTAPRPYQAAPSHQSPEPTKYQPAANTPY